MKIAIEDYFGNDVVSLEYNQVRATALNSMNVSEIALSVGYNIADEDQDDNGQPYIRVQECNIDNSDTEGKKCLIELVNKLNEYFL